MRLRNGATVKDVAEGLDIPAERVELLLDRVRAERAENRARLVRRARAVRDTLQAIGCLPMLLLAGFLSAFGPPIAASIETVLIGNPAGEAAQRARKLEKAGRNLAAEDEW